MQGHKNLNAASTATLQRLRHFQGVFRATDVAGDGSLNEDEFLAAFRGQLGSDDKSLKRVFMAIDSNCAGCVNWEEFSAWLLMEQTAAAAATAGQASEHKAAPAFTDLATLTPGPKAAAGAAGSSTSSSPHQAAISCLLHADAPGTPDRWYSAGSNGVVQVWNGKDLSHMRSYQSGLPSITSAACLPSSGMLALGSYSRSLLLLDPTTGRQAGRLENVVSTAACSLTAWPAPAQAVAASGTGLSTTLGAGTGAGVGDGSSTSRGVVEVCRDLMAVGDADGSVRLLQLDAADAADKTTRNHFTTRRLWHSSNHRDWVVSVLHCPQISSVAAASLDKTVSLTDLERCIAVRVLTGHTKAVHCCAWNSMLKVVASGSADRRVLLWNPFSCRTLGALQGHTAPVVCLSSNERDMQIISASADSTIKVWDLRNQRCLQTLQLSPAASALGGHQLPLSAMAFSPQARLLVAGAVRLRGWRLSDGSAGRQAGHREAVGWAGYNGGMQEVVSTDHAGMVCCWELTNGRLLHSFGNTHGSCRISAATLDGNCRRLITGAEDGSIKVWNVRSGSLLSTLSCGPGEAGGPGSQWGCGSGVEVTGLALTSSTDTNGQAAACIVATGWDRKVSWYADSGKRRCPLLRSFAGPDSDVLATAAMPGHPTLATAHDNGEVWLWNLDSGAVLRKLLPPGLLALPQADRAVEAVAFMHGDLRHILVAAGADRVVRFWDCHSGSCLEHDTSHLTARAESLRAVAVPPDNSAIITADTSGQVTVWDVRRIPGALQALAAPPLQQRGRPGSAGVLSPSSRASVGAFGAARGFNPKGSSRPQSAAPGSGSPRPLSRASCVSGVAACVVQQAVGVEVLATWRAHADAVTALVWVPAPASSAPAPAAAEQASRQTEEPLHAAAAEHAAEIESVQQPGMSGAGAHLSTASDAHVLLQQQQQQQPQCRQLEAAEGQQQARQLLALMQQQQQQQQQQHKPRAAEEQQQPQQQPLLLLLQEQSDLQQRRLTAAVAGMRVAAAAAAAAADAADVASSSGSAAEAWGRPGAECCQCASLAGLVLTAGLDRRMMLWSASGAKVGAFGIDTWDVQDVSTWQDPGGCCCEGRNSSRSGSPAAAADVLLPQQHSLEGSSSSSSCCSDCTQLSVSPQQQGAAAVDTRRLGSDSSTAAQQRHEHQQSDSSSQPSGHQPAGSCEPSPRQPILKQQLNSNSKAVAFADGFSSATVSSPVGGAPAAGAAAAAAVAAALAEARLPAVGASHTHGLLSGPDTCDADAGGTAAFAVAAAADMHGSRARSFLSPRTPQPGCQVDLSSWQQGCAVGPNPKPGLGTAVGAWEPELPCLAAEEDVPTTLWLPEFNHISRPATAAQRQPPALASGAGKGRPSTAAAALGGGLHGRLSHAWGGVPAAAGRKSVGVAVGAVGAGGVSTARVSVADARLGSVRSKKVAGL